MTNLINTITSFIKSEISGLAVYNDIFPDDKVTGIIAVHDPATRKNLDFIDGTAELQTNVSFIARYGNAKKAREILSRVLNCLEGVRLTDTEDGYTMKIETISNIQFLSVDNKNNALYSCSVKVVYKA